MINSNNSSSNSNHSIIILEMIILGKTVINIISIEHPLRADCTTINSSINNSVNSNSNGIWRLSPNGIWALQNSCQSMQFLFFSLTDLGKSNFLSRN